MAYKYMHLIDGEPAHYVKGEQIVRVDPKTTAVRLADSRGQVLREQIASERWRKEHCLIGYEIDYGYVKIRID